MLYRLPTELIHTVFEVLDSYSDHINLSSTCQKMFSVSLTPKLRCKLLEKFFSGAESNGSLVNDPSLFSSLCEFIEAANIKPISDDLVQVLEQQIETSHFINYHYRSNLMKGKFLDVFRPNCQIVSASLINIPNKKCQKALTARHITVLNGPRRIYYDIELPINNGEIKKFKCVFYNIDKVVAFTEQDYSARYGTMQFKDEGLLSDISWSSIFEAKESQINNMVINPPLASTTNAKKSQVTPTSKSSVLSNAYQSRLNNIPSKWTPCLLRTFEDCKLQTSIRKGGLVKSQEFRYVFMYENQADDTICLEFCTLGSQNQHIPGGYLLMKEHAIQWNN
jgi:hypothetical protein